MDTFYSYWEVNFISCEGNKRHAIARAPLIWDEYDVREHIPMGGTGDDVAEILSIEKAWDIGNNDYSWDLNWEN